jgi:hypothetical protein
MVIVLRIPADIAAKCNRPRARVSRWRRCQDVHEAGRTGHGMAVRDARSSDARPSPGDGLTSWSALEPALHAMSVAPSVGRTNEPRCSAGQATSVPTTVTVKSAISNLDIMLLPPAVRVCSRKQETRLTPFHSGISRQGVRSRRTTAF